MVPVYPMFPQGIGNISTEDNQDGTYDVWMTITRAGLYRSAMLSVYTHAKQCLVLTKRVTLPVFQ